MQKILKGVFCVSLKGSGNLQRDIGILGVQREHWKKQVVEKYGGVDNVPEHMSFEMFLCGEIRKCSVKTLEPNKKVRFSLIRALRNYGFDAILKIIILISIMVGFGQMAILVIGSSDFALWVGGGAGVLFMGVTALYFHSESEGERTAEYERNERKKAEAQRDDLERKLNQAMRIVSEK